MKNTALSVTVMLLVTVIGGIGRAQAGASQVILGDRVRVYSWGAASAGVPAELIDWIGRTYHDGFTVTDLDAPSRNEWVLRRSDGAVIGQPGTQLFEVLSSGTPQDDVALADGHWLLVSGGIATKFDPEFPPELRSEIQALKNIRRASLGTMHCYVIECEGITYARGSAEFSLAFSDATPGRLIRAQIQAPTTWIVQKDTGWAHQGVDGLHEWLVKNPNVFIELVCLVDQQDWVAIASLPATAFPSRASPEIIQHSNGEAQAPNPPSADVPRRPRATDCELCGGTRYQGECMECDGTAEVDCEECQDGRVEHVNCGGSGTRACFICRKLGFLDGPLGRVRCPECGGDGETKCRASGFRVGESHGR